MTFIRTKHIKGKPYAYLVENTWKKQGARQKVGKYLGRILERKEAPTPEIPLETKPEDIVSLIIKKELSSVKEKILVNIEKKSIRKSNRVIVISMNGGYLCDYTLAQLLKAQYARNEERPGTTLAEAFARAGLRIPQHAFITLYKHHTT